MIFRKIIKIILICIVVFLFNINTVVFNMIIGNASIGKIISIITLSSKETVGGEGSLEEVETLNRSKKRGESNRIYLNTYPSPWRLLPTISFFQINDVKTKLNNLILEMFGLKSKYYKDEPTNEQVDFNNMIKYRVDPYGIIKRVNKNLKRDLMSLNHLIKFEPKESFFYFSYKMGNSIEFFMMNLINWKYNWYDELSLWDLIEIIKDYKKCVNTMKQDLPRIREVWIEDGKKWRVLAIAKPGVRLFLSGLTKFLMQYFDEKLDRKKFHGFMHSRGINTYWQEIFNNDLLNSEIIIEMDFSACFNNVRKAPLIESLWKKYYIPKWFIKILITHLNSEISQKDYKNLPSLDGVIERYLNKDFNLQERNLIQGLPICPLLANIAIKNGLDDLTKELNLGPNFEYLTYADDLCLFLNKQEFEKIGGEEFVRNLNKSKSFQKHGLKLDLEKSIIVKKYENWLRELKLLGIKFDWKKNLIKSETRGRAENKLKGRKSLPSMSMDLKFKKDPTFYENLTEEGKKNMDRYLPNHKEIDFLSHKELFKNEALRKYFNTLISYIFKGSVHVEQNFNINNTRKNSILWKILKNKACREFIYKNKITIHAISFFLIHNLYNLFTEKEMSKMSQNLIYASHKKQLKTIMVSHNKEIKKVSSLNVFQEFKLNLKLNYKGLIGYEETNIDLNYGDLEKYYKKSKEITTLEKKEILMELRILDKWKKDLDET